MVTSPPAAESTEPGRPGEPPAAGAARLRRIVQHRLDPHLMLLERGLVAAIVTPTLFAVGLGPIGSSTFALFATFASFATIGLVWFGGPTPSRAKGYAAFAATAAVLVVAGTLCSESIALAVI